MKRFFALVLVFALISLGVPTLASAAPEALAGRIAGTAKSQTGQPLANYTVQVRNVATGQLAGTAKTSAAGEFAFGNLAAGNYVGEVLDAAGRIVATSSSITLADGAMSIAGVTVTANGAFGEGAAAAAGGGSFFKSTAFIIIVVAAGAGTIAAIVATRGEASPSK